MRTIILVLLACNQNVISYLFPDSTKSYGVLELIHTDIWGPTPIPSTSDFLYYISFIDHASRHTWIYLLKTKSEATNAFLQIKVMVENMFSKRIKIVQSDGGQRINLSF